MSFAQGAGFRICGSVVRRWTASSGKFGTLVLDVFVDGKASKIDLVTFDCVNDFSTLAQGALVEVTGRVGMQKLSAKDKTPIKIDGYEKWVPQLIVKVVKVEASSRPPASRDVAPNPDGDQGDPTNW